MRNDRINFIKNILDYSVYLKEGETVYINYYGEKNEIIDLMVEEIKKRNCKCFINAYSKKEHYDEIMSSDEEYWRRKLSSELDKLSQSDVYISLMGDAEIESNDLEYLRKLAIYKREYYKEFRDYRLKKCRWLGLRLPIKSLAVKHGMSLEEFEEYYYRVCGLDYKELYRLNEDYRKLVAATNEIVVDSRDTSIVFRKNGIGAVTLCGNKNLPDGEIYTAPLRTGVDGHILYNTSSMQDGFEFKKIFLRFKSGVIEEYKTNNDRLFEKIISSYEGSRSIGELAFGINPMITTPCGIILYDEKMYGSIHTALGQCYSDTYNGNNSELHWDLVKFFDDEDNKGVVYFDGQNIIENGKINYSKVRRLI